MNCRTFHRKLEDYLEGGLDFSGRFGMERHAQQCIGCGKTMADAQRLGQMARELKRVKAPLNFEASILKEIGNRKLNSRFARFRRLWIYSFEWPSWRKPALVFCSMAVLLLGGFYAFYRSSIPLSRQLPSSQASAPIVPAPLKIAENPEEISGNSHTALFKPVAGSPKRIKPTEPPQPPDMFPEEIFDDQQEAEYLEYSSQGPGNRPVVIRMPLPIQRRLHGQPSEKYFIRNVSH